MQAAAATASHPTLAPPTETSRHLLHFSSLFNEGRGLAFPCDAAGRVDLDTLSDKARGNYFFARAFVGRDFSRPEIRLACGDDADRGASTDLQSRRSIMH